jgi:hypothetical protein
VARVGDRRSVRKRGASGRTDGRETTIGGSFPPSKSLSCEVSGVYTNMENWAEIRRRVLVDGLSKRAACRAYNIHWDTLTKILEHAQPPGYRRAQPRPRPKLERFLPVIHRILEEDKKAPIPGSSGIPSTGSFSGFATSMVTTAN